MSENVKENAISPPAGDSDENARWVVRDNGRFTDLHSCGEPHQYAVVAETHGLALRRVSREDWVAEPRIIEVNCVSGHGWRMHG